MCCSEGREGAVRARCESSGWESEESGDREG